MGGVVWPLAAQEPRGQGVLSYLLLGALAAYLLASLIVNPVVQLTTASEAIRSKVCRAVFSMGVVHHGRL